MKKFSVIIPVTDPPQMGAILSALHAQTTALTEGEVIVIGSDRSGQLAKHEWVRYIPTDSPYTYASDKRNVGIRAAQGEILLFLDDDCIPRPEWIKRHLTWQARGIRVMGGSVEFPINNYFQLADNLSAFHFMTPHTAAGKRAYLCTANLSVHRSVIDRIGMMEAHQNRAEDLEWTLRMRAQGFQLYFDPGNIVLHDPERRSLSAIWQHWIIDAPATLRVRLQYANLLNTPRLARYRAAYLFSAPLIAAWAAGRVFTHWEHIKAYWHTLPLVYLTKLAWCWSAYRNWGCIKESIQKGISALPGKNQPQQT
jgi:GT2 family glycosyltransferase